MQLTTRHPGAVPASPDIRCFVGMPAVVASPAMHKVIRFIEKIAASRAAVLITGESGSGKEVVSRCVHELSAKKDAPFVDINCAALPDHLLESELFGYEKGAFSGADTAKPGMFELASGGTLFLDEIGELNLKSQSKLLRVLDGWPHYRLGGTRKIEVNVRIVAATNADLESDVRAGKFRGDLFHRLNQVRVSVPPLRDRIADIGPLSKLFLTQEKAGLDISSEAVEALELYPWPGNVRELKSLMALVAVMSEHSIIQLEDLPPVFHHREVKTTEPDCTLGRLEQEAIFDALAQTEGRRDRAAELLGISRRTLIRKLKVYGVPRARSGMSPAHRCVVTERS
jgi:transcriptional regulator with PAS, ATPase and Fis domain